MNSKNDLNQKYSKGSVVVHWLTTVLILALFPMGKYMSDIPSNEKATLIAIHAILGMTVFVLTIYRSYLFFKKERPKHLVTGSKLNDKLVVWIHNAFYFLLFIISFSGIGTMILGGYLESLQTGDFSAIKSHSEIPPLEVHEVSSAIMMILLLMHIVGVVKHYIFTKENTLKRIW